jgi:Uma2 family endonuclease
MAVAKPRAAIEDLYRVLEHGKAEIVGGEIVLMSPTGARPGRVSGEIYYSLRRHEEEAEEGYALPDNVSFIVHLPGRDSFSPDAAWYVGDVESMKFLEGAPLFAVEVRSESDYGPQAEREMAQKRADYFAAGTQVVWDVDPQGEDVIRKYTKTDPERPVIFRRGDFADAEPAVPGWRMAVDQLFRRRSG